VTILHKIHYSIEVPKTKTDYWFWQTIQWPKDTKGIIRSRKSNDKQQWDILYYYYSKKKARENDVTSCDVTTWLFWGPVGHHNLGKVCYRKWRHRKSRQSRDRKWRHRKWRYFPSLFSYYSSSTKYPIVVCHSIYGFWLFLWYLLVIATTAILTE
jgi:hypothetical protein